MGRPIADLHNHPSLKPHGNKDIANIWVKSENKKAKEFFTALSVRKIIVNFILKKMAVYSQSNLQDCFEGQNRLIFCSIYPFERPFMKPVRPFEVAKWLPRQVLKFIFKKQLLPRGIKIDEKIISLLTGVSRVHAGEMLEAIYDDTTYLDYYKDYLSEYQYLLNASDSTSPFPINGKTPVFKLVKNYGEFLANENEETICGIITTEGIHAFGKYVKHSLFTKSSINELPTEEQEALASSFIDNIKNVKSKEYPPFFITFSHHFNSLVAGQAKSFADGSGVAPGFSDVFDQKRGVENGITAFAKALITQHLLSRENGPRILIDTKHMSINARRDFYEMIHAYNIADNDNVPIISSHTAISGMKTLTEAEKTADNKDTDDDSYVSRWDINLTDEDILEIFKSDGLIGICMHDGRMPGERFKKKAKKLEKKTPEDLKKLHVQIFMTNVFHIVDINHGYIKQFNLAHPDKAIDLKEAWKTICLGSDNDGIVDPFDNYDTAASLDRFRTDCITMLREYENPENVDFHPISIPIEEPISPEKLLQLLAGQSIYQVMDRVFYHNTSVFLSKYFTDEYLRGAVV